MSSLCLRMFLCTVSDALCLSLTSHGAVSPGIEFGSMMSNTGGHPKQLRVKMEKAKAFDKDLKSHSCHSSKPSTVTSSVAAKAAPVKPSPLADLLAIEVWSAKSAVVKPATTEPATLTHGDEDAVSNIQSYVICYHYFL
ncbi:hypothetical protein L208DRAFT_1376743 [Tricholoma matsutake]|nr:hypothetical protein L208DRAFT_1376742 [Tricholoma matsutake 945]KAF8234926.1 hypothetical protein L208DRAFT_1376743 [Tricholoma matsutake 945]